MAGASFGMFDRDSNTFAAKFKRNITCFLAVRRGRDGGCRSCGACCRLPYPCPMLRFDAWGRSRCAVYGARPLSCRVYPRSPREHITHDVCGFRWTPVRLNG